MLSLTWSLIFWSAWSLCLRCDNDVSTICFGPKEEDNYIQHVESGKKIKMRKKGGAYVVDVALVGSGQTTEITIDSAAEEPVCPREWAKECLGIIS